MQYKETYQDEPDWVMDLKNSSPQLLARTFLRLQLSSEKDSIHERRKQKATDDRPWLRE